MCPSPEEEEHYCLRCKWHADETNGRFVKRFIGRLPHDVGWMHNSCIAECEQENDECRSWCGRVFYTFEDVNPADYHCDIGVWFAHSLRFPAS